MSNVQMSEEQRERGKVSVCVKRERESKEWGTGEKQGTETVPLGTFEHRGNIVAAMGEWGLLCGWWNIHPPSNITIRRLASVCSEGNNIMESRYLFSCFFKLWNIKKRGKLLYIMQKSRFVHVTHTKPPMWLSMVNLQNGESSKHWGHKL